MKYIKKEKFVLLITLIFTAFIATTTFAHPGRTDSNGGHKDNKNASGLGSYHYHCDGYPAHLHTNGVCPYTTPKVEEKVPEVLKPVEEVEEEKVPEVVVPEIDKKEEETPKVIKPVVENKKEVIEEPIQKVEEEKKEIIEEPVQDVEKEEKSEEELTVENEIEEVEENVVETSNSTLELEETENETVNNAGTSETGLGTLILLGGAGYLGYKKFKG